jgi:hypothetical protein
MPGLAAFCKDHFDGWGPEVEGQTGLARAWTGVLGWSVDLLPLVGEVPGRPGLWISASYNGEYRIPSIPGRLLGASVS